MVAITFESPNLESYYRQLYSQLIPPPSLPSRRSSLSSQPLPSTNRLRADRLLSSLSIESGSNLATPSADQDSSYYYNPLINDPFQEQDKLARASGISRINAETERKTRVTSIKMALSEISSKVFAFPPLTESEVSDINEVWTNSEASIKDEDDANDCLHRALNLVPFYSPLATPDLMRQVQGASKSSSPTYFSRVWSWGSDNTAGQLAIGSLQPQRSPRPVPFFDKVSDPSTLTVIIPPSYFSGIPPPYFFFFHRSHLQLHTPLSRFVLPSLSKQCGESIIGVAVSGMGGAAVTAQVPYHIHGLASHNFYRLTALLFIDTWLGYSAFIPVMA